MTVMSQTFRHEPISTSKIGIRLLLVTVDHASRTPTIEYSLRRFSLRDCPEYHALSYTWGPEQPTYQILIDQRAFDVRKNLYDFLQEFCRSIAGKKGKKVMEYIWIDQVCIDQTNAAERNAQARIMDKIYQAAKSTLIWLGCGDEGSARAMKAIKYRHVQSIMSPFSGGNKQDDVRAWLDSNPYWKRTWILQEVLMSPKMTIMCGSDTVSFESLDNYWQTNFRLRSSCAVDGLLQMKADSLRRYGYLEHDVLTLTHLFSEHTCEDPRDKIFALQSLMYPEDRQEIDYAKSTEMVWLDTAVAYLLSMLDPTVRSSMASKNSAALGNLVLHPRELLQLVEGMNVATDLDKKTRERLLDLTLTVRSQGGGSSDSKSLLVKSPTLQDIRSKATNFVRNLSKSSRAIAMPTTSTFDAMAKGQAYKMDLGEIISHIAELIYNGELVGVDLDRFDEFRTLFDDSRANPLSSPRSSLQSAVETVVHDRKLAHYIDLSQFAIKLIVMVGELESGLRWDTLL